MPSLLAMSFEGDLSPSFELRCLQPSRRLPDGWGIGFYPGGDPSATVLKEPRPPAGSIRSQIVAAWEHLASSIFVLHIRHARWGQIADANTQPFLRSWGRRDWLFSHSGSLDQRLEVASDARFEPVGSTDTEAVFCDLMSRMARAGLKTLRDVGPERLRDWLAELNELGALTCAISDGSDLVVYSDAKRGSPVYLWQLLPPYDEVVFGDDDLKVDLTRRGTKARKGLVVCSGLLQGESEVDPAWQALAPGSLIVVRQGAVVAELGPAPRTVVPAPVVPTVPAPPAPPAPTDDDTKPAKSAAPRPVTRKQARPPIRPRTAPPRRLEVHHRTIYRYDKPVERSTHLIRLEPMHDRLQRLAAHQLNVSVDGQWRDFDDVFGNRARRLVLETPFTELAIDARSLVVTLDSTPLDLRPLHARTLIPLNWMPWQRQTLQPYLLPPELPESQLIELFEYAMSFVKRNDYDLVDSLLDMTRSIYTDYSYKQGTTTVFTTPFEVYTSRRGVCQDFTNLFICLARLLGIPARYMCGYLYTGPKHENRAMAEATHAWAQVYIPEAGWKGFDPTNGVLTQTDHVRVAVGRNYLDATPTGGTIFVGGGQETLEVTVTVEEDA